jgi:long-chain acyl-CoA synthetase
VRPHLATLVDDYRRHGTQKAVVVHRGNREYVSTYDELASLVERFAAELMRRQITIGDRVVLWGQNSSEWIAAFFGRMLRGVLVVPLNATGGQRLIAETQPRLLVGDQSLLARLATDVPRMALEEFSVILPRPPFDAALQEPSLGPDTPLQILFTSGTTSEGRVPVTRELVVANTPFIAAYAIQKARIVILAVYHGAQQWPPVL